MIATALLALVLLHPAPAQSAAEGVWLAEYKTTEGRLHEFTLTLKVSGSELSGTIASPRGSVAITEGTADGREVSFTVMRRANYDEIAVTFTGSVEADVMRLTMRVGARAPVAVTARRQAQAAPAQSGKGL